MLNNVLMGIQLALAVFLMLVIMPQEGKDTLSQILVVQKKVHKLTLSQKENKHFLLELQR